MCIFLSWLHYEGKDLFIDDDTLETSKGKALIEYLDNYYWEDIVGHGALVKFHKIGSHSGDHIEVASFRDPTSFPKTILEAINKCKFRKVGAPDYVGDMLEKEVYKTYDAQKTKEQKIHGEKRKTITFDTNVAVEKLRATSRKRSSEASEIFEKTCIRAYETREIALTKLAESYDGPKNICPERKAYIKKKEEIRDKYFQIEIRATIARKEANGQNKLNKEIDNLFKDQNINLRDASSVYKEKMVHMFWDLFADKNNRTKIWRNII